MSYGVVDRSTFSPYP